MTWQSLAWVLPMCTHTPTHTHTQRNSPSCGLALCCFSLNISWRVLHLLLLSAAYYSTAWFWFRTERGPTPLSPHRDSPANTQTPSLAPAAWQGKSEMPSLLSWSQISLGQHFMYLYFSNT